MAISSYFDVLVRTKHDLNKQLISACVRVCLCSDELNLKFEK